MTINWTDIRRQLLTEVQTEILPSIAADNRIGSDRFTERFNSIAAHWRPGQHLAK
jgi:hypothetical protein